jgi:CheY-like chemotaxis protein
MKKIVVAESSPTIKSVADTLLRQNGYDVVCTSDGLQAWEVINSGRPDLVLTGLNLSGINGLELCRQMAGDGLTGGIPVVVLVGSKDNVSADELKSSGVKGKLQKPFSPRDLLNVVKRLIGKGEETSQPAPISKNTNGSANNEADAISSTRHSENNKGDDYNLDWTDLSDKGMGKEPDIKNEDPADGHVDDQEILLNEDQFGLASLNAGQEKNQKPREDSSSDEDYDWFVGEMKKENSGEPGKESRESISPKGNAPSDEMNPPAVDDDEINFEDFESSGAKMFVPEEAPVEKKIPQNQAAKVSTIPEKPTLSEEEISRIADKVVQKLAAAITANIDRKKILEAINSVVKQ